MKTRMAKTRSTFPRLPLWANKIIIKIIPLLNSCVRNCWHFIYTVQLLTLLFISTELLDINHI
jgi:hypothetical protein